MELNISCITLMDSTEDIIDDEWLIESALNDFSVEGGENFIISSRQGLAQCFAYKLSQRESRGSPPVRCICYSNSKALRDRNNIRAITLYDMAITEIMEWEKDAISIITRPDIRFNILLVYGERLEMFLDRFGTANLGPLSKSILRKLGFIS